MQENNNGICCELDFIINHHYMEKISDEVLWLELAASFYLRYSLSNGNAMMEKRDSWGKKFVFNNLFGGTVSLHSWNSLNSAKLATFKRTYSKGHYQHLNAAGPTLSQNIQYCSTSISADNVNIAKAMILGQFCCPGIFVLCIHCKHFANLGIHLLL